MPDEPPLPSYHVTALDRVGLAMLAGAGLSGLVAVPLTIAGGARSVAALLLAWVAGAVLAGVFIVVAAPIWMFLHRRGMRGPAAAAVTAATLATIAATAIQLWGTDGSGYRWASALATSVPVALAAAAIGLVMQCVAYRRLF